MHRFEYYAPSTVAEALNLLHTKGEGGKILAGGTDLMPQMKERGRHPKYIVSLRNLNDIRGVRYSAQDGLRIGAGTRFGVLQNEPVVKSRYDIIVQCAQLIGSKQTQNLATVGGNVCNAAPSADAVPGYIVLDADVTIQGPSGSRTIPITEVFLGPGQVSLSPDELLTEVHCPVPLPRSAGVYIRHVPRKELDIAVAGVGVYVQLDESLQRITHARVCLSSVAPIPLSAKQAEQALMGQTPSEELYDHVGEIASGEARPISDQRGSAAFRRVLVKVLTARTLRQAVETIRAAQ